MIWKITTLGFAAALSMGTASAFAVADCCSAMSTSNQFFSTVQGNDFCASNWTYTQRADGKLCLPLGAGYACGIQNTLTVGQEFTLSGEVSIGGDIGGVSVGVSTTYKVEQAFQHTAGNCQSCQLYASYSNATVIQWDVHSFYPFYDTQKKRTVFYKRGAPTIIPCCEVNNNCPGCPENEAEDGTPIFMAPESWDPGTGNGVVPDEITYIVDLRFPEFYSGTLPAWHPMNTPGTTFATLNCWQRWEILREIFWLSSIVPEQITELVIIDTDGSPHIFDLVNDPGSFGGCPADLDCNGILDLLDIGLFVDYFTFGDPTVDFDFNGVLDLVDITTFTGAFLAGCP